MCCRNRIKEGCRGVRCESVLVWEDYCSLECVHGRGYIVRNGNCTSAAKQCLEFLLDCLAWDFFAQVWSVL